MAILKVARLGHPVLRRVAEPFTKAEITSRETRRLVQDMLETMAEYDGAGLAAPQVHVSKRLLIYGVESNPRYPDAEEVPVTVLFNPEWKRLTDETELEWEGCLSLPGLRGQVRRYNRIRVEALDEEARPLHFEAEAFHARVFQHEVDHLDGVVFVDRMESMDSLCYLKEWQRFVLGRGAACEEGDDADEGE